MAINRNQISAPQPPGLPNNQQTTGATAVSSGTPVKILIPQPNIGPAPQGTSKPPSTPPPPKKQPLAITFWFNAFIPNNLPWIPVVTQDGGKSKYLLIAGLPEISPGALRSFSIGNTDDRSFSSDRHASRKTQIGGNINVTKKTCVFDKPATSPNTHLTLPPNSRLFDPANIMAGMADMGFLFELTQGAAVAKLAKPLSEAHMRRLAYMLSNTPLLAQKGISSPAYKAKPRFYTSSSGYVIECVAVNREPVVWNTMHKYAKAAKAIYNFTKESPVLSFMTSLAVPAFALTDLSQIQFRSVGNYIMPAIDMGMKLFFSKDLSRLTGYEITIDNFPAFEVYVQVDNNPPVAVFQKAPEPGTNPLNLINVVNPKRVFKSQNVIQLWNP